MGYSAQRRFYASAVAIFGTLMLVTLALIARSGVAGATDRIIFGIQLVLWNVVLTGFPFALSALLQGPHKQARGAEPIPKMKGKPDPSSDSPIHLSG